MKNILIFPNVSKDEKLSAAIGVSRIAHQAMARVHIDSVSASVAELPAYINVFEKIEDVLSDIDMVITLGGDGTILHAAGFASPRGIPILGVNLGKLGFMAELESEELQLIIPAINGQYVEDIRTMLDVCVIRDGEKAFDAVCLNDAVITKGAVSKVINLDILADGQMMARFSGDGVIVSTPTGSTAYSMSACGPIVEPDAENIIITPICPHALYARSFVLAPGRRVEVQAAEKRGAAAYLSADGGDPFALLAGDRVAVKKSEIKTRLARLKKRSFYDIIYSKLTFKQN